MKHLSGVLYTTPVEILDRKSVEIIFRLTSCRSTMVFPLVPEAFHGGPCGTKKVQYFFAIINLVQSIFRITNISYPLILIRACA